MQGTRDSFGHGSTSVQGSGLECDARADAAVGLLDENSSLCLNSVS